MTALALPRRLSWSAMAARRPVDRIHAAVWMAGVDAIAVGNLVVVWLTGGTPNVFGHLGYVPTMLAAYRLGWRAAVPTGILLGLLLGPIGAGLGMPSDGPEGWFLRGLAYTAIGLVVGILFDRMRGVRDAATAHAESVENREREVITAFARSAEAKDEETGQHVLRVQDISLVLARATGMGEDDARRLGWAAMLHDLGKLHVPDRILRKPGPLDPEEWEIMRQHPIWGEQILRDGERFALARRIARSHHENFDGSGYPDGLAGATIPLEARIVRIADSFDAMTSRRPYAEPRSLAWALEEIDRYAGRQFDPELAALFIELTDRAGHDLADGAA